MCERRNPKSPPILLSQSHSPCRRNAERAHPQIPARHPEEPARAARARRQHCRRGAPQKVQRMPHVAAAHQSAARRSGVRGRPEQDRGLMMNADEDDDDPVILL